MHSSSFLNGKNNFMCPLSDIWRLFFKVYYFIFGLFYPFIYLYECKKKYNNLYFYIKWNLHAFFTRTFNRRQIND